MRVRAFTAAIALTAAVLMAEHATAGQTNVAVAANFTDAAKEIAAAFKAGGPVWRIS